MWSSNAHVMDFSLRLKLREAITVRIDAKNLMDSPYVVSQGSVTREYYRAGRTLQTGLRSARETNFQRA